MRGALLRLRIGRSSLRAEAVERGSVTWAGEASYGELGELADAIARLAAEPPRACRRLSVALERPPVQLRDLRDLPPVRPRHLAALVAQQAGRFFRRNGQPLVTDAIWAPSMREKCTSSPLVSTTAMFIFQFRFLASASAAAITCLARSSPIETP